MIRLVLLLSALAIGGIVYLVGGRRKRRLVTRPAVRFTYFCYGFAVVCAVLLWGLGGIVAENWGDIRDAGALPWLFAVYALGTAVTALFVLLGKLRTYPCLSFSDEGMEACDALSGTFKGKRFWRWSQIRRLEIEDDVFALYDNGGAKVISGWMFWNNADECLRFAQKKIAEVWA